MFLRGSVFVFLVGLSCVTSLTGDGDCHMGLERNRLDAITDWLHDKTAKGELPGGVAMIQLLNGEQWHTSAGDGFEEHTLFRIASMTKPVVAVAGLTLVEQGRLGLGKPLADYLPQFKDMQVVENCNATKHKGCTDENIKLIKANQPILIKHLFQHTAGFGYSTLLEEKNQEPRWKYLVKLSKEAGLEHGCHETHITLEDNINILAKLPLLDQPGNKQHYSLGLDVLGRVIEVITGKALDTFIQETILDPLEMSDTYFNVPPHRHGDLAPVFFREVGTFDSDKPLKLSSGEYPEIEKFGSAAHGSNHNLHSGGCGLVSTATDYGHFLNMIARRGKGGRGHNYNRGLQSEGATPGSKILGPIAVDMMMRDSLPREITPLASTSGTSLEREGFGLGWHLSRRDAPHRYAYHGGAYGTFGMVDYKLGVSAVFMSQCLLPGGCGPSGSRAWKEFINLVYAAVDEGCTHFGDDPATMWDVDGATQFINSVLEGENYDPAVDLEEADADWMDNQEPPMEADWEGQDEGWEDAAEEWGAEGEEFAE